MPISVASVVTENASRYLQQLCKHWSHRFSVSFTPEHGRIDFGDSQEVKLEAAGGALVLRIEAASPERLPELERIVADHLRRFAFREELSFEWQQEASEATERAN